MEKQTFVVCSPMLHSYACVAVINQVLNYRKSNLIITNYNKPYDFLKNIEDNDDVYIVNFALPINVMKSLNRRCKVVWITHSESVINEAEEKNFKPLGIRDINQISLISTWKYFYNDKPLPYVLELISDYEQFNFHYDNTEAFNMGAYNMDLRPYFNKHSHWAELLSIDKINDKYKGDTLHATHMFESIIKRGEEYIGYRNLMNELCCEDLPFKTNLGGYKILAMNAKTGNSFIFNPVLTKDGNRDVQILITFDYIANVKKWRFSAYRANDIDDINVGDFCSKFGGGGRDVVGGFALTELPKEFILNYAKTPKYKNTFKKLYRYLETAPSARYVFLKNMTFSLKSKGFDEVIDGKLALCINTHHTTKEIMNTYDMTGYEILIQYVYMKTGIWQLHIHKVLGNVSLNTIKIKHDGFFNDDNALVLYLDELNFKDI